MGWLLGIGIPVAYVLLGSIVGTRCRYTVFADKHMSSCDVRWKGQGKPCDCGQPTLCAVLAGLLFPLGLVILFGWYIAKPRAEISRSERKLKALDIDIAERERELGIGRSA